MNMTIATTTSTDIRYEYVYIVGHNEYLPQFSVTTVSFTILSLLSILVIIFLSGDMNRLQVVSVIERRNKIQVIDDDADIALTLGRGRL